MDNHTKKAKMLIKNGKDSKMHKKAAQIFAILPIAFCVFWRYNGLAR
jgi:hypothetical protein